MTKRYELPRHRLPLFLRFACYLTIGVLVCLVGPSAGYADERTSGKNGAGVAAQEGRLDNEENKPTAENASVFAHVGLDDTIVEVTAHPAFVAFGRFLFPLNTGRVVPGLTIAEVGRLLPYHGHVDPAMTVKVINDMIDRINAGKKILLRRLHAAAEIRRLLPCIDRTLLLPGKTGRSLCCGLPRRRFLLRRFDP